MRTHSLARLACLFALVSALIGFVGQSRAEPLVTRGMGLMSCAKIVTELRPKAGLNHLPNALLYTWVQGYLSAANIFLLNEYTNYIDLSDVDDQAVVHMVYTFCKANPDDQPISAIDKFIREVKKTTAKEDDVYDPWEQ